MPLFKSKPRRLSDNLVLIRNMGFAMIRDNNLCAYSEDCEHPLCRRVHHIITDACYAQNHVHDIAKGREIDDPWVDGIKVKA